MEDLVGAGGVPGEDDLRIARGASEGDHRADVGNAVAEALESGADEALARAGDGIVAARVELEVAEAGASETGGERGDERLPGGEDRAEPGQPDEGAPIAAAS